MLVRIGSLFLLLSALTLSPTLADGEILAPGVLPDSVRRLQEYLQIDTTNPPGNEKAAAEMLAGWIRTLGVQPRLLESDQGRTSIYARFAATRGPCPAGGGALLLMHHIDVVPAGEEWRAAPFSGRLLEGKIWGRGAVDSKSLGVAALAALEALQASKRQLCRDVVFLAVADEEAGGGEGTAYLLEHHAELFEGVDAVINEGGANRSFGGRQVYWGIEVVQKRPFWLRISADSRGGHGSRYAPSSATHMLIRGLDKLIDRPPVYRVTEAARLFLGRLGELEGKSYAQAVRELEAQVRPSGPSPPLQPGLQALFLDTLQVTEITTGSGINVVSPRASAYLDIRLLPDTDSAAYLQEVQRLLGPELEVEVLLASPPTAMSPLDHPLYRTFEQVLGERAPVIPSFLAGTTDSRYFRARGIAAYGLSPFSIAGPDLQGIHAANEYIRVDDFLRGVETTRRLLERYAAAP